MRILVTGAKGFIGKNLRAALREIQSGHDRRADHKVTIQEVYEFGRDNTSEELERFCTECDFVFHLAGVNRAGSDADFIVGNRDFTLELLALLKKHANACPIMFASSVQADLKGRFWGSVYGESKRAAEELLSQYAHETGADVMVYRFPNVFGKWCRPNYNSAIATFCYNTARGLPIQVNDPAVEMNLVYIDDLVEEMIQALRGCANRNGTGHCSVPVYHEAMLGEIADTIQAFPSLRERLEVPQLDDPLINKLYATYVSYLPAEELCYDLKMNQDDRGSFTELFRSDNWGQFSVNISKPGVTKGNHWHHTKNEKFIVVKGDALIRMRRTGVQSDGCPWPVEEFRVSGDRIQVVEMIPGYTHSITNCSDTEELVTVIWANEPFDAERPDTFFEQV